jgi:hypothetical protein
VRLSIACAVTLIWGACFVPLAAGKPPPGLTGYGRLIWNLDALLHERFGNRPVYVDYPGSSEEGVFSTQFTGEATSRYYIFTFARARGSAFKTERPAKPPRPVIGTAGSSVPLKLGRAFISCGHSQWLFEHTGQGAANWELFCRR